MRVIHLSTYDIHGGAAIAANTLHNAISRQKDVESIMLVANKQSIDKNIHLAFSNKLAKKRYALSRKIEKLISSRRINKYGETFSFGDIPFFSLVSKINSFKPDVVHIHWVQSGFFNFKDLKKINAPIIWTLHDLWPISDGRHYFEINELNKPIYNRLYKAKQQIYKKKNISFVGVSLWEYSMIKESNICKNNNCVFIPNAINCKTFNPLGKNEAKKALQLNVNQKVVLFGAVSPLSNKRKGFDLLSKAINKVENIDEIQLVVFGVNSSKLIISGKDAISYGVITNPYLLSLIYSAADVMIVPSIVETFGLTAAEALACNTPVVGFNHSGLKDIVAHKKNGYLADPYDVNDLANGINWVLSSRNTIEEINFMRNKILDEFSDDLIAEKHIELYQNVLVNAQ